MVAVASALLSAAGLALVAQAPASAATVRPVSAQRASASVRPAGKPGATAKSRALPRVTGLGSGNDFKPVCGTPKKQGEAACMALLRTNVKAHKGITPSTAPSGYGPSDLQSAYGLPSATVGRGETVAVVDAGNDPTAEADLGVYRAQYGLPPCTTANGCFEKVNQEGQRGNYPSDLGWNDEESLDVDMVSAICPNCHILLVEANSASVTDLGAAENEAVALGAKYISNSYSTSDQASELQWDAYYNHPGVVITASAGDSGYGVGYPSASQYVTAVGGTTLTQDSSVPRGWNETVWGSSSGGEGTGSGCSAYEPKPAWQHDTGCANRTVADVSAVADPNTGVAVYDSTNGGWGVFGGTSVASPLIASVYALAGPPIAGTYPSSYPYTDTSGLNDVTSGADGSCTPAYLCTAGPGYDGPTGLGTPDGVTAFSGGPHGDVTGQVTSASTGKPLAGARVSAAGGSTVTSADGDYDLTLPAGTYNVTAADYGYNLQTADSVTVTDNATTTANFPLTAEPTATVGGTVTDGSGHGWPLYASISINGVPGAPVYTNPHTGAYRVTLPQSASYTMTVTPVAPGYQSATQQITVGTSNMTQNITAAVNTSSCVAPGYGVTATGGITERFTGWTGTTPQDGWTVTDNEGNGQTWAFDNPGYRNPPPGFDADFAIIDSGYYSPENAQDTSLVSPEVNLSGVSSPAIGFDTAYYGYPGQTADVDLSLDGGQTWVTVWQQTTGDVEGFIAIPVPQAAGQSDVQVRFHFTHIPPQVSDWWALDNVAIGGNVGCNPLPGGLVAGVVKDGNTGRPVNGAAVASVSASSDFGVTAATPGDPHLSDGFYEFFSSLTGRHRFTAADSRYQPQAKAVTVAANAVTTTDFTLQAGHLAVTPSLSGTARMGGSVTKQFTITNTGKTAAQETIGEQTGSFTSLAQAATRTRGGPAGTPWVPIPGYVPPYNVAGYDDANGKAYSAGGASPSKSAASAYDPRTQTWSPIAPMPVGVDGATGQFLDGKFYVFGGASTLIFISPADEDGMQIYDPATNKWHVQGGGPAGSVNFAASATLDGQMYVVGGCPVMGNFYGFSFPLSEEMCYASASDSAARYDPATGKWTTIASYPLSASNLACGGVAGELVCTGGVDTRGNYDTPKYWVTDKATYIYNPATNTWSPGASLPIGLWGMSYGAANGQLLVSGGVTRNSTEATTRGFAYQPATNSWTKLPASPSFRYMGGSACGFFQIGGHAQSGYYAPAEELPGYDQCGDGTRVPWLSASPSQLSVPAGGSVTVRVTLDGAAAGVTQPGAYTAALKLSDDTPYAPATVGVTMNVTPPKSWGKITGTVTGAACGGTTSPLPGATVQIDSWTGDDTLTTGADGRYELWLDRRSNPLTLIVTKNGWRSQSRKVNIKAGQTTTSDFTLAPQACS